VRKSAPFGEIAFFGASPDHVFEKPEE